jgi:hypothetical protein
MTSKKGKGKGKSKSKSNSKGNSNYRGPSPSLRSRVRMTEGCGRKDCFGAGLWGWMLGGWVAAGIG